MRARKSREHPSSSIYSRPLLFQRGTFSFCEVLCDHMTAAWEDGIIHAMSLAILSRVLLGLEILF